MREVKPNQQSDAGKKEQVEQMFNSIAKRYDLLNRFLSMGIDQGWRRKAIRTLQAQKPALILDVATGTADLAIEAMKLNPEKVIGLDLSAEMLEVGRKKVKEKNLGSRIELVKGDSEALPFTDNQFDAITVAFGVRNFENLQQGLNEMYRVLKPGGRVAILEFSKPRSFPFRNLYNFYFRHILPLWGGLISKSREAYEYLPESVQHFPEGAEFLAYLQKAGYRSTEVKPLTFGTCSLYTAIK